MSWVYWLPIVATALSIFYCWVPGGSLWNFLGYALWSLFILFGLTKAVADVWIPLSKGAQWRMASARPVWPALILFWLTLMSQSLWLKEYAFETYKGQLEAFAKQLQHDKPTYERDTYYSKVRVRNYIGAFPIFDYAVEDDGGVYLITEEGILCRYGFAYKPNVERTGLRQYLYSYKHLSGDWYLLEEDMWF